MVTKNHIDRMLYHTGANAAPRLSKREQGKLRHREMPGVIGDHSCTMLVGNSCDETIWERQRDTPPSEIESPDSSLLSRRQGNWPIRQRRKKVLPTATAIWMEASVELGHADRRNC